MNARLTPLLTVSCLTIMLYGTIVTAQGDQRLLAEALLGSDLEARSSALTMASSIDVDDLGPELRMALITTLQQESDMLGERSAAIRRGETRATPDYPMVIVRVARLVASLGDPRAIPALAASLGQAPSTVHALAAFGEQAAPSVIAVVMSANTRAGRLYRALNSLQCMVRSTDTNPLSISTLEEIRLAAEQRLTTGQQAPTTLLTAIDLAIVLDDAGLRQIVENFASDRSAVDARLAGAQRQERIELVQNRAASRLADSAPLFPCVVSSSVI